MIIPMNLFLCGTYIWAEVAFIPSSQGGSWAHGWADSRFFRTTYYLSGGYVSGDVTLIPSTYGGSCAHGWVQVALIRTTYSLSGDYVSGIGSINSEYLWRFMGPRVGTGSVNSDYIFPKGGLCFWYR